MAQNQFVNHPQQYPHHPQQVAQQPLPHTQQTGQTYDPRFYQQQQHQKQQQYPQYYQQYPGPQSTQLPSQPQQLPYLQQHYSHQPQASQQLYYQSVQAASQYPKLPSSPQPPVSSPFRQPAPPQYGAVSSPHVFQHQSYSMPGRPPPPSSPQPQYFPSQTRTSPITPISIAKETTPASPRPQYAYLPQRSVFPADNKSDASSSSPSPTRPLPTPKGRPISMPPTLRSPLMPSATSDLRRPSVSPTRSSSPLPFTPTVPVTFHRPPIPITSSSPPKNTMSSRPTSPSRPLPTPSPRSVKAQSLDLSDMRMRTAKGGDSTTHETPMNPPAISTAGSSFSSKRIVFPPAKASGQPFVPHWKRIVQASPVAHSPVKDDVVVRGIPSAGSSTSNSKMTGPIGAAATRGRPLPPSPAASNSTSEPSKRLHLEPSENDGNGGARASSPQYGILDMPRSRFTARVESKMKQSDNENSRKVNGTRTMPVRASTLPQPPTQSVTLQMASMSLRNDKGNGSPTTQRSSGISWPTNLPPLPRVPKSPSKYGIIDLDDAPPPSLRRSPSPSRLPPSSPQSSHARSPLSPSLPTIQTTDHKPQRTSIPKVSFPADPQESDSDDDNGPLISVSAPDADVPQISVHPSSSSQTPKVFGGSTSTPSNPPKPGPTPSLPSVRRGGGLSCGGCGHAIIGRIVSAMGTRWHPGCFRCCVCDELLENLSSYEKDGRPYCHLDYHEAFAPKCFHCHTTIVDERFITLDDHELGKRTYHEQHFFCAECGDPFLPPSAGNRSFAGDGAFEDDDVGFTVYKGHPYCESCHVRLRMPKCKRCKRSIRDGMKAVEALGGKWCWECFVCASCEQPFESPSFFQRKQEPFCERCFSIMIRNEI